jgi:hypothetical protein
MMYVGEQIRNWANVYDIIKVITGTLKVLHINSCILYIIRYLNIT